MFMFVFFMRLSYDYLYSRMVSFPLWLFCSPQMFLQWVNICIICLHFCLPLFFLLSQAYQCRTIRSQMTCKQPNSGQVNITQFWKKALCRFCHSPRNRTVGFWSHLKNKTEDGEARAHELRMRAMNQFLSLSSLTTLRSRHGWAASEYRRLPGVLGFRHK